MFRVLFLVKRSARKWSENGAVSMVEFEKSKLFRAWCGKVARYRRVKGNILFSLRRCNDVRTPTRGSRTGAVVVAGFVKFASK